MKQWQWIAGTVGLGLVGLGVVMALTKPEPAAFDQFAIGQIKAELCPQAPLGLDKQCPGFVDQNQPQIAKWVRSNTRSQDYLLFSRHESDLSLTALVPDSARPLLALMPLPPAYHLETIGAFGNFYVYKAQKQR
jgi:Domain of unknown function (DUF4359)